MDKQKKACEKSFFLAGRVWAFSYSKSQVDQVIDYIKIQEIHHYKKSFIEEYLEFLEKFEVPYDGRYIFNPVEYNIDEN